MRFIANGPNIPDELLTARDAGQVLFFCGAGVSQAEAHLPNFLTLAANVLDKLGSAQGSPARQLLNSGKAPKDGGKPVGQVPIDRVFNLLEREFEPREVREAVAMALKPAAGCNLGPHQTLLDLSRTRSGIPRVVTTNFDLLFEACDPNLDRFSPPHLPDPSRPVDFRGIIHLHGRVDDSYQGAHENEFVLSSAEFGHAYLSNGWATRYIQALLDRFKIVFVGYSADDPPIQYLLEAMTRFGGSHQDIYAFHGGSPEQGASQWSHRGVQPITFDTANNYTALWSTLAGWAERARDVDQWHDRLIAKALDGPAAMAPHERGMIAHLASSPDGARRLAVAKPPLPPEWLFVFDRKARYGRPIRLGATTTTSDLQDPFDAFGLDGDALPKPLDPNKVWETRPVPADAWHAFDSTEADRRSLSERATARLMVNGDPAPVDLPTRLSLLSTWIVNIAHQPVTLWWAAEPYGLHATVRSRIQNALSRQTATFPPSVREGWRLLFASSTSKDHSVDIERYGIEARAKVEGWSPVLVREAMGLYKPILTISRAHSIPPSVEMTELTTRDVVRANIEYPSPHAPITLPDETLAYAIKIFRQHLEHAVQLELELSNGVGFFVNTLRNDDNGQLLAEHSHGATGHLIRFTGMVASLAEVNLESARKEVAQWAAVESPLREWLLIWASSQVGLTSSEEAGEVFLHLDDNIFWGSELERDLLFAMRDRWKELPESTVAKLEARLQNGHFPWDDRQSNREKLTVYSRLDRLYWLSSHDVEFTFDCATLLKQLGRELPEWTKESSRKYTARPKVGPVRHMGADVSPDVLEDLPLDEILKVAKAQEQHDFDSVVQKLPFQGLVSKRPVRALRALTIAAKRGDFEAATRAWPTLLRAQENVMWKSRMLSQVGRRLAQLPKQQLLKITSSVSDWLLTHAKTLFQTNSAVFASVWDALIAVLMLGDGQEDRDELQPNRRDWVNEAINRVAGRMAEALFKDSWTDEPANRVLPVTWKRRAEELLLLPGDHRYHALAILSHQLPWLFHRDAAWTETHVLSWADLENEGAHAFWAGFFWAAQTPQPPLYARLKPRLLALAQSAKLQRENKGILGGILLQGWGGNENAEEPKFPISDREMREALICGGDQFRTQVIRILTLLMREDPEKWNPKLLHFLNNVWPRQRAVKTEQTSGALVNLAFEQSDRFPEIVDAILDRLGTAGPSETLMPGIAGDDDSLAVRHPEKLLDLLWTILVENPLRWPYGAAELLHLLSEQNAVTADPRLAELRRREHQGWIAG